MCFWKNRSVLFRMVETRSGPKVKPKKAETRYCHQTRGHHPLVGGLTCFKCTRFWCAMHLKLYDESTRNGPPSEWLCYYCLGSCICSECIKPIPRMRKDQKRKPKPKEKENHAQTYFDAPTNLLKTIDHEGSVVKTMDFHPLQQTLLLG